LIIFGDKLSVSTRILLMKVLTSSRDGGIMNINKHRPTWLFVQEFGPLKYEDYPNPRVIGVLSVKLCCSDRGIARVIPCPGRQRLIDPWGGGILINRKYYSFPSPS
jgi:hypothetical protein